MDLNKTLHSISLIVTKQKQMLIARDTQIQQLEKNIEYGLLSQENLQEALQQQIKKLNKTVGEKSVELTKREDTIICMAEQYVFLQTL